MFGGQRVVMQEEPVAPMTDGMTFEKWLAHGQEMGWASEVRCVSHDTLFDDRDDQIAAEYDIDVFDLCVFAVRINELGEQQ